VEDKGLGRLDSRGSGMSLPLHNAARLSYNLDEQKKRLSSCNRQDGFVDCLFNCSGHWTEIGVRRKFERFDLIEDESNEINDYDV
jgi:hypothetical protein